MLKLWIQKKQRNASERAVLCCRDGALADESITVSQLRQLMTLRGNDCIRAIHQKYGGTEGLCQRLDTDTDHGLSIGTLRLTVLVPEIHKTCYFFDYNSHISWFVHSYSFNKNHLS